MPGARPSRRDEGKAWLVLETGDVYEGLSFGAAGESSGEVVFNTGMSGYTEVLTDPSYCRQIVVLTSPHVGNYGIHRRDFEWHKPSISGLCILEETRQPHHASSFQTLSQFLKRHGVVCISGVPTRQITLRLRERGSLRGIVTTRPAADRERLASVLRSPSMTGRGLVDEVTTAQPYLWKSKTWSGKKRVAVLDFGVKRSLLEVLRAQGCSVKVFPALTPARELQAAAPNALVLSNGPGDPAALKPVVETVRRLMAAGKPVLGICLGHQLIGLAAGGRSYKLGFGHHGINHPVRDEASRQILITSQNHGFAIRPDSLPRDYAATHVSLNDGTLEGFRHRKKAIFAFQFHPEAAPGPTEGRALLREFVDRI